MSPYRIFVADNGKIQLPHLRSDLQIPELDPEVFQLAEQIFAGAQTSTERVERVEKFFHENFQYELGVTMDSGEDRLSAFLLERPPAHCEYFATAATILLRIAGIPARYVTGFVVEERNAFDGTWIARRKDAHAWAEAYDAENGRWVTVEATPMNGVPRAEQTRAGWQAFDAVQFWLQKLRELARRGAIEELVRTLLWPGCCLLLIGLAFSLLRRPVASIRRRLTGAVGHLPPQSQLMEERVKMDRCLEKLGLVRTESETVLSFARRLDREEQLQQAGEFARWYRDYARLRFEQEQPDPVEFDRIRNLRRELTRAPKSTSRRQNSGRQKDEHASRRN